MWSVNCSNQFFMDLIVFKCTYALLKFFSSWLTVVRVSSSWKQHVVCCLAKVLKLSLYDSLQQILLITTGDSLVLSKIRSVSDNFLIFIASVSIFIAIQLKCVWTFCVFFSESIVCWYVWDLSHRTSETRYEKLLLLSTTCV